MSDASKHGRSPGNFLALLGLAFIILRLCGVIGWPWWAVTLPVWGSFAVSLLLYLLAGAFLAGVRAIEWHRAWSRPWERR